MGPISEDDGTLSGAKVNVGIRMAPAEKKKLAVDAAAAGVTLGEYAEYILLTRHEESDEITALKQTVSRLQQEGQELRNKISKTGVHPAILTDERLLWLLHNLKGKKDIVENTHGDNFPIEYNTPQDVLLALIYSCKLNT